MFEKAKLTVEFKEFNPDGDEGQGKHDLGSI